MPKRPCAIVVIPGDTILCADKFGDVYSLPLLGQTNVSRSIQTDSGDVRYAPSATSLTVHTKGNREALRQQQKTKHTKTEQRSLCFEHQLLLGHVSLLTDIVCATATFKGSTREYVITSDRDEHIRVSRGMGQANVIESYCLGHKEFISRLCVLPAFPHLLLSGGGDDYLLLWNWQLGTIQQRIDLKGHVQHFKANCKALVSKDTDLSVAQGKPNAADHTEDRIAVTNIITTSSEFETEIIVSCEGYVT